MDFSLNGQWRFKGFPECNGEELGVYKPEYREDKWLVGQVPGTVYTDLMANKVIVDPFKGSNENKVKWVSGYEWWYRREIELPSDVLHADEVELVFDGLDTFATVWVNDKKVGEANNMFTPWRFRIKKAVKAGKNVVIVRFKPVYKIGEELEKKYGGAYGCLHADNCSCRPYIRKAQYTFGWDWGPTLPTAGIWQSAKIVTYDKAKLGYLAALPTLVSEGKATVKVLADLYVAKVCEVEAKFVLEGFGQRAENKVTKKAVVGQSVLECDLNVVKPHLWWPNGYGEQNLYDVSVELRCNGVLLDKVASKCGIRSVRLLQEPDEEGVGFTFAVNGKKVFCKGVNWIPADSFLPRVTEERYRQLLERAVEMNVNMIRVWGGGIYEDDAFYDLCDKLGIMVWQDFMYACSVYPEMDWFVEEAQREAELAVQRLRGHACIVVWCGNNEIQWQHQTIWKDTPKLFGLPIFNKILPSVVESLDGTRPYRQSTPYDGEEDLNSESSGTRHNWVVWSKGTDYSAYLHDKGRFLAEFGWQAPPTLDLLREYLDDADLKVDSPVFEAHEKQVNGLKLLRTLLSLHYPVPADLERFVLYAQLNQGEALKTAVTHWRSRMFKTSGCLIWQLNDCWPVVSWSLIDYGANPKPAYFFVKRALQPVITPLLVKDGVAYGFVVNETPESVEATFGFEILRFNGERLHSENRKVAVPPYSSLLVFENAIKKLPLSDDCILAVTLKRNGMMLCEDAKTVLEPKDLKLPKPQVEAKAEKIDPKTFKVTLQSLVYLKAVHLGLACLPAEFSDNFFDLLPNKPKIVECRLEKEVSLKQFEESLSWEGYPYV